MSSAGQGQGDLAKLRNIGPTIRKRLSEASINTRDELEAIGPVEAFRRISANNPGQTIPVCYYLYSLQGALTDQHWDAIPEDVKADLRQRAGVDKPTRRRRRVSGDVG
jgi:DNA transformation protein